MAWFVELILQYDGLWWWGFDDDTYEHTMLGIGWVWVYTAQPTLYN